MKLNWKPPKITIASAQYKWSAPYAPLVHEGGESRSGGKTPARPWTDVAIAQSDIPSDMAREFRTTGSIDAAFVKAAEELGDRFQDVIDNHDFGYPSSNEKRHRPGVPTWGEITDSGDLRDSQSLEFDR